MNPPPPSPFVAEATNPRAYPPISVSSFRFSSAAAPPILSALLTTSTRGTATRSITLRTIVSSSPPPEGAVVHDVDDDVRLFRDPLRGPDHIRVQGPLREVDAGAVDKDDLAPGLGVDSGDPVPCGLGLGGDDRDHTG